MCHNSGGISFTNKGRTFALSPAQPDNPDTSGSPDVINKPLYV